MPAYSVTMSSAVDAVADERLIVLFPSGTAKCTLRTVVVSQSSTGTRQIMIERISDGGSGGTTLTVTALDTPGTAIYTAVSNPTTNPTSHSYVMPLSPCTLAASPVWISFPPPMNLVASSSIDPEGFSLRNLTTASTETYSATMMWVES